MTVHFPIALVITTLACDFLFWWSADKFWVRAGIWASGGAFFSGVVAGVIGTAELLLVSGIRARVASWAHGVAAIALISVAGANWGGRTLGMIDILPHGLGLSLLASGLTALAGWHGGKLIFDHGIGLMVSPKE
ncbi:DUF2231 domain-containing protein [uncultured Agrobacterium sp.]